MCAGLVCRCGQPCSVPAFPPLPVGVPQLPLACETSLFFSTVGVKFLPPVLSVNAPFLLTVGLLCFRPLDKFYPDFKVTLWYLLCIFCRHLHVFRAEWEGLLCALTPSVKSSPLPTALLGASGSSGKPRQQREAGSTVGGTVLCLRAPSTQCAHSRSWGLREPRVHGEGPKVFATCTVSCFILIAVLWRETYLTSQASLS